MTHKAGRYPIAVDTDGQDLFAIQLKDHKGQVCIKAAFHEPLNKKPANSEDVPAPAMSHDTAHPELSGTLKRLKKTKGFSGRRIILHLPMEKMLSFPVNFKLKKDDNQDWALLAEIEKSLPYALEDAVADYPSIYQSGTADQKTAIITAAKKKDVLDLIAPYKKAGFLVEAVDFSPLSLVRIHGFLAQSHEKPDVICHIGRSQSSLIVVGQNRIYALNKFNWGRNKLKDRLDRTLKYDRAAPHALDLLKTYGLEEVTDTRENTKISGIISRILTPPMEELIFEFHKVLGYALAKEQFHSIGNIYFYGLGATVKGLNRYIEQRLNIPATLGTIKNHITWEAPLQTPDMETWALFSPAIGLAARRIPWR
ncbi:pilus assembly protein PilM [uncultured Desulfobacter sp.]|uniref:pilus assembly protein PilM n=1 Tax=uncultured Desulfobacter sp. TaxID=240139 RepID=UPI0029F5539B|nr:pilus assembly protein PilM [uncultured Desulfobacter sp.]